MRDVRYSSRPLVSLDRPQLIGLAFFAILSGGLMFGVGYATGKNRRTPTPQALQNALTRVDEAHVLHQEMKHDLTFYKALTEPVKVEPMRAEAVAPSVARVAEAKSVEAKPVEPKLVEAKLEETEAPEAKQEVAVKDNTIKEMTFTRTLADPDSETIPEATVVAVKPAPLKAIAPSRVPVATLGEFTIQVSAFKHDAEAQAVVKKLQSAGFQAAVVSADLGAKGIWYRVRIGKFAQQTSAEVVKQRLDEHGFSGRIMKAE